MLSNALNACILILLFLLILCFIICSWQVGMITHAGKKGKTTLENFIPDFTFLYQQCLVVVRVTHVVTEPDTPLHQFSVPCASMSQKLLIFIWRWGNRGWNGETLPWKVFFKYLLKMLYYKCLIQYQSRLISSSETRQPEWLFQKAVASVSLFLPFLAILANIPAFSASRCSYRKKSTGEIIINL